jgi:hypothetical protein
VEMRAAEAIFRVLTNKAAQGNTRAAALVEKLRDMWPAPGLDDTRLS